MTEDKAPTVPVEGDRERSGPRTAAGRALLAVRLANGVGSPDRPPQDDILAIEREAGVSLTGSGLDVERLARAQVRSGIDTFLPGEDRWISANEAQAAIAREYAALSGESGEPEFIEPPSCVYCDEPQFHAIHGPGPLPPHHPYTPRQGGER